MTDVEAEFALREILIDWPLAPPIRMHVLPDGILPGCRGLLGVMAWNLLTCTIATGPLLAAYIAWLRHDPRAAVNSWRLVCDRWAEVDRPVAEQAWHGLWAQWMRWDPKAAMRHWAKINAIDPEQENESLEVFKRAIKMGEGVAN
jgi:hypothetical protein